VYIISCRAHFSGDFIQCRQESCCLLEDLRQHFEKFGDISDCIVSLDSATGRSKGFGFVTFSDTSVVDQVVNSCACYVKLMLDFENTVIRL